MLASLKVLKWQNPSKQQTHQMEDNPTKAHDYYQEVDFMDYML